MLTQQKRESKELKEERHRERERERVICKRRRRGRQRQRESMVCMVMERMGRQKGLKRQKNKVRRGPSAAPAPPSRRTLPSQRRAPYLGLQAVKYPHLATRTLQTLACPRGGSKSLSAALHEASSLLSQCLGPAVAVGRRVLETVEMKHEDAGRRGPRVSLAPGAPRAGSFHPLLLAFPEF